MYLEGNFYHIDSAMDNINKTPSDVELKDVLPLISISHMSTAKYQIIRRLRA